jgi:hypothetical protein
MRGWESGEDCIRLHESRSWDCQLLAAIQSPFDLGCGRGVVFVPCTDRRHHAATVE